MAFLFAVYLASLIQTANTPSPFYAVKWFHELFGFKSPTDLKLVINILESSKRLIGKQTVIKTLTKDILLKQINNYFF